MRGRTGRLFRQGANTGISVAALVGLLILVNAVAAGLNLKMDVSSGHYYTLSAATKGYLKGLRTPVKIYAFYGPGQGGPARMLLTQYREFSPFVSLRVVDPARDPSLAQQFGVQQDGTIVFANGKRRDTLLDMGSGQNAFNAALATVTGPVRYAYFLAGHGEKSPADGTSGGLSQLAAALNNDGFRVRTLALLGGGAPGIPADCAVLVVADPTTGLLPAERGAITAYLRRGGEAIFTSEPGNGTFLNPLLLPYGVRLSNGAVADFGENLKGADPATPEVTQYPSFSLNLTSGVPATYYPTSAAVEKLPGSGSYSVEPLVQTSANSVLGKKKGTFTLAAVLGNLTGGGNVVVFADTDFLTNAYNNLGNQQLFLRTVRWLDHSKQDLAAMSQTSVASAPLIMPVAAMQTMFYVLVLFLPLGMLAAGGIVWWQRR